MTDKLIIIGASGHGKVVADIAKLCGYNDIIFLDDYSNDRICAGYPIKGSTADVHLYSDYDFFVAIGDSQVRERMLDMLLSSGFNVATLIHPNSVVSSSSYIGFGSVVMAGAVVNPFATVGKGCIVNTCSSIDHDCIIDDYVHISVGAHLCGTVKVGKNTWIGTGAVVVNDIEIAENSMIGAGAVVVSDLSESGTYIGVPAKKLNYN